MKRTLSAAVIALLLLSLCLTASADGTKSNTLTSGKYTYLPLNDGTAKITKYEGDAEELVIPDRLDRYVVSAIDEWAFSGCSGLTSVSIPDSVAMVDGRLFESCDALLRISVSPDHPVLATIDGVLFSKHDKRLICYPHGKTDASYQIPSGIQIIGNEAFSGCASLTSVFIPDSVTVIGDGAFFGCYSLSSISLPDSVTVIGDEAFHWCPCLTTISIPRGVTVIGNATFFECDGLTSVSIPDGVTAIKAGAFYGCSRLRSITLPPSLTTIEDEAFYGCSSLTAISIPDSVSAIGDWAFSECSKNLVFTVGRDSYAARYCKEKGLNYTYQDSLDWLKN